jgi:hypothetical protein
MFKGDKAMRSVKRWALGAAGVAALAMASAPAEAQYPGYGYPYGSPYGSYGYPYGNTYGNYQYGYPTNVIGQVLQSILNPYGNFGYGGYGRVNPQVAVNQCVAGVQQRLAYRGGYGGYGGYNNYGYGNAYNNARIVGISRVEQRSATTIRVRGYASSGRSYGYGGYGGYGYGAYGGAPDLTFRCDVDYRGYIRDIDINRRY